MGEAVTLTLDDEIDISRGDIFAPADEHWHSTDQVSGMLVWLHETPLQPHRQYEIRIGSRTLTGFVESIDYRVDIEDFSHHPALHLQLNEIAHCQIRFTMPIPVDPYAMCHETGALIFVDRLTNATMGAAMIVQVHNVGSQLEAKFSEFEIELNALICKHFPHWGAKNLKGLL